MTDRSSVPDRVCDMESVVMDCYHLAIIINDLGVSNIGCSPEGLAYLGAQLRDRADALKEEWTELFEATRERKGLPEDE